MIIGKLPFAHRYTVTNNEVIQKTVIPKVKKLTAEFDEAIGKKIWSTGPLESDKNSSSKFYSKSLTLLVCILELVKEGTIAADIARCLNMKKPHVSYYITKAKKQGYLKQITRDAFAILELTQAGKNFLDQYTQNNPSIPICRLGKYIIQSQSNPNANHPR